jgi:hypothetical protein
MHPFDDEQRCEACLTRPAFGLMSLHTQDGEHVAAWWTCCECADHDAPIHAARGMLVSVVGSFDFLDLP